MTDQDSVAARKAASAAGAVHNSGVGVDGDDASVADVEQHDGVHDEDATTRDAPPHK